MGQGFCIHRNEWDLWVTEVTAAKSVLWDHIISFQQNCWTLQSLAGLSFMDMPTGNGN